VIAFLRGNISILEPTHVVIDCGGVGYLAKISLNTYSQVQGKKEVHLFTYLQVREDAHVLFGFSDHREQELFEHLISISGVGGNTAMMILSSISPENLIHAIRNEDLNALKSVKGIGAKTAGRIILELKDKLKLEELGTSARAGTAAGNIQTIKQEALVALTNLGLPKATMEKRLERIFQDAEGPVSVEEAVKLALRNP
jgi:holliday junction DNA helicase RuvA